MRCTALFTLLLMAGLVRADENSEKDAVSTDYKPLSPDSVDLAGPLGNLDIASRRFGILKGADAQRQQVTLLLEGETEPKTWPLSPGAELWRAGWWGRLDQFTLGDRVWVWFQTDGAKQPVAVSLLADELSEQDAYAPVKVKDVDASGADADMVTLQTTRNGQPQSRTVKLAQAAVFRGDAQAPRDSLQVGEQVHVQTTGEDARLILDPAAFAARRAAQKSALRKRWANEGLPGTLIFLRAERHEAELMLDHEAMRWGRALQAGDKVVLQAGGPIPVVVQQVRPWRERTQVLLGTEGSGLSSLRAGQRVALRLSHPPPTADDDSFPTGLGKSRAKTERLEWLVSSIYCTCGMHDGCAGQPFTLAACTAEGKTPCGLAKGTREELANWIEGELSDRQIVEQLLSKRGPNLLRPHLSP